MTFLSTLPPALLILSHTAISTALSMNVPGDIPDTSLNGFQIYNHLGYHPFMFQTFQSASGGFGKLDGIDPGLHNFDIYEFNAGGIKYYDTRQPFTELFYILGSKNEQLLKVLHTQNINKNFNAGVEYRRSGYDGFYARQKSGNSNFAFFTRYKSKNGRYILMANAIRNNLSVEENGGIYSDSLFENGEGVRKNTIAVHLDSAQSRWKGQGFFIKQFLNLGYSTNSIINDSIDSTSFAPNHRLSHSFLYEQRSFLYEDNNPVSGFYRDIYNDSLRTYDLVEFLKVENEISWTALQGQEIKEGQAGRIIPEFYLKHQYIKFSQNDIDTSFNDLNAKGILSNGKNGKFYWEFAGDYGIYGRNEKDYSASLSAGGSLEVYAGLEKRSPWLIHNTYSSNHFRWENNFVQTGLLYGKLKYSIKKRKFEMGASINQINKIIYFDTLSVPQQFNSPVNIFSAYLVKDFILGKWNFNNGIIYQYVGNINVIRLPEIVSIHSLYFEDHFFKRALFAQIGTDIFFNTAYYADAYMSATGQFYLQNEKQTGNYPYIDIFVNFKVKRARMFFKIEHINSGLMGNVYYMVPHYPMPDRAFKFGISWMFYD